MQWKLVSEQENMSLPVPPQSSDPDELRRYILSLHYFLGNLFLRGTQISMVTAAQISQMTTENELSQVAKFFYDTTNDEYYRTKKSGDNLVVEAF